MVDADSHKIGELEAIYVDTGTDLPSFGTVKVGMPTRHRLVFMPFDQTTAGLGYLRACYDKKQVKDAPSTGTGGELPARDEEAIFKHGAWATRRTAAVSGSWPPLGGLTERRIGCLLSFYCW